MGGGNEKMALMNCPECGKEISDKAKICIYCGYPLEDENAKKETDIQCQECGSKVYHDMGRCPVSAYFQAYLCVSLISHSAPGAVPFPPFFPLPFI